MLTRLINYQIFPNLQFILSKRPKTIGKVIIRNISSVNLLGCNLNVRLNYPKDENNIILKKRFGTGNSISRQTEELFKMLVENNSSVDLKSLCIKALEHAMALRELSMIVYSTHQINLDFDVINQRIIYLLPSEIFSNILVLMRVLIDRGYYNRIKVFNELVSKFLAHSFDDKFSDSDLSNYVFVYSKLVQKGLIKSSNDNVESLFETINARIDRLNSFNFADVLQSLSAIKSTNVVVDAEKIVKYMLDNINVFNPEEVIAAWYSITSLNISNHILFVKMVEMLLEIMLENGELILKLEVDLLVKLVIAIGRSRINDINAAKLIDNLIPQLRKLIEMGKMTLYETSKILVALNNCNYKCDSLVNRISKYFRLKYQELPNDDEYIPTIVNLCIGFGRFLINDKRVFNIISQLLLDGDLLKFLSTQELINIIQAFSKVRLLDTALMAHIHRVLEPRIDSLSLELSIKYIHSISILEFKNYNVQKEVLDIIQERYKNDSNAMNEFQIAKVCYAASKLDIPCELGDNTESKNDGLWISGYRGRKTSHITAGRKPIHVRRMKKIW